MDKSTTMDRGDSSRGSAASDQLLVSKGQDSEANVIGAILSVPDNLHLIGDRLEPNMFCDSMHREIFASMVQLSHENKPIDMISVRRAMRSEMATTATPILADLSMRTSGNIEYHAAIIIEEYCKREVFHLAAELQAKAMTNVDAFDLMDEANMKLAAIDGSIVKNEIRSISNIIAELHVNEPDNEYHKTGFDRLDEIIGGWTNSNLIIVAARPGMGKTSFALTAAHNLAKRGLSVGIFSFEMSRKEVVNKMRSFVSGVPSFVISKRLTNEKQQKELIRADRQLSEYKIFVQATSGMRISEFRSQAIRMVRKHRVRVLFVDYLQLLTGTSNSNGNRVSEVSEISRTLKQIAMELDIPVIALSQLNRQVESRNDKMPQLADLRESGAIEQDANIVTLLYRPEYYKMDNMLNFEDWNLHNVGPKGICTMIIAKNRNGKLSNIPFEFNNNTTEFTDFGIEDVPF